MRLRDFFPGAGCGSLAWGISKSGFEVVFRVVFLRVLRGVSGEGFAGGVNVGPVIEDVVDGLGVGAFAVAFFREELFPSMSISLCSINRRVPQAMPFDPFTQTDSLKTGPFKEGVDVPHLRLGFDPGPRTCLATASQKIAGDARPSIRRMQHHPRHGYQLLTPRLQLKPVPMSR